MVPVLADAVALDHFLVDHAAPTPLANAVVLLLLVWLYFSTYFGMLYSLLFDRLKVIPFASLFIFEPHFGRVSDLLQFLV